MKLRHYYHPHLKDMILQDLRFLILDWGSKLVKFSIEKLALWLLNSVHAQFMTGFNCEQIISLMK
jgi:hypothetical protein